MQDLTSLRGRAVAPNVILNSFPVVGRDHEKWRHREQFPVSSKSVYGGLQTASSTHHCQRIEIVADIVTGHFRRLLCTGLYRLIVPG